MGCLQPPLEDGARNEQNKHVDKYWRHGRHLLSVYTLHEWLLWRAKIPMYQGSLQLLLVQVRIRTRTRANYLSGNVDTGGHA